MSKPRARGRTRGKRSARGWGRWLAALGLGVLVAGTSAAGFWFWSRRVGARGATVRVDLTGGEGREALGSELERAGLVDHPTLFGWYLRLTRAEARVKAGPHLLRRGLSPAEIMARLTRSTPRPAAKVTIVEGFNRFQVAERLEKLEVTPASVFLAQTEDAARLEELGVTGPTAEGYLFPATYDVLVDSEAATVMTTFVREAKRRAQRLYQQKPGRLEALHEREGWGELEVLTLASIVEKEAADRREHGNIASVFFNRLHDDTFRPRRMLQSDATAPYGCLLARAQIESCQSYSGLVTPAMLRDASNPYNTYKHAGLPPGPIGSPSESAILSVLDPPVTPYFFFVAGSGKRHVFSRTFLEHERAIATGAPSGSSDATEKDAVTSETAH